MSSASSFTSLYSATRSHFQGGNNENNPNPGDYLGMVYKGGFIVPILMSMLLMVITFSIERMLTISKAKGSKSIESFVRTVRQKLNSQRHQRCPRRLRPAERLGSQRGESRPDEIQRNGP